MSAQRQASSASQTPHLSPAELSYLYTSLALPGSPIRPDGRSPTQFRPLTAETDILPGTNGSARVGFADGTQAIVGVKAEVEKTVVAAEAVGVSQLSAASQDESADGKEGMGAAGGHESWVQISIEIPGFRDDDALPVFLSEMMREPLIESVSSTQEGNAGMAGGLKGRLVINRRWHWRLYIDVRDLAERCMWLWGYSVLIFGLFTTGFATLAASIVSASFTLSYDALGAFVDETPQTEIHGRRGPVLRR